MGVPKRKVAHARQGDRRSHLALTLPKLVECPHCHQPKLQHRVCPACGWYNGRQAVALKPAGGSPAGEEPA
jgi:large subunit ribosomal protein L32